MTEHSIAELERQEQQAQNKLIEAQVALSNARIRLNEGRLNATGLKGHIVKGRAYSGGTERTIVVEGYFRDWRDMIKGRVIRKNGELGTMVVELPIANVTDLGPYKGGSNE